MTIARVALPVARRELFDYWVPAGLAVGPGSVVRVRLARRALCGAWAVHPQLPSHARSAQTESARWRHLADVTGETRGRGRARASGQVWGTPFTPSLFW